MSFPFREGEIKLEYQIGQGSCGEVWSGVWTTATGQKKEVAIKVSHLKSLVSEGRCLKLLEPYNIVPQTYGSSWNEYGTHYLVQDKCLGFQDLFDTFPAERERMDFFWPVVTANVWKLLWDMQHCGKVTNRDLKPEHLLVSEDGNLKLADFDLATEARYTPSSGTTTAVAPPVCSKSFWTAYHCAQRKTQQGFTDQGFEGTPSFSAHQRVHHGSSSLWDDFESSLYVVWAMVSTTRESKQAGVARFLETAWRQLHVSKVASSEKDIASLQWKLYQQLTQQLELQCFVKVRNLLQKSFRERKKPVFAAMSSRTYDNVERTL